MAFEEDTSEQPGVVVAGVVAFGVAPAAGEKGKRAAGHGNDTPVAKRYTA
jgi:hypothetical protein